jgi:hypothetical protein
MQQEFNVIWCDNNNIIIIFLFISGEQMEMVNETYDILIWYLIAKILH